MDSIHASRKRRFYLPRLQLAAFVGVGVLTSLSLTLFSPLNNSNFLRIAPGQVIRGQNCTYEYTSAKNNQSNNNDNASTTEKAVLCTIMKNETRYVDDWVKYHLALGFDEIHIYDNSQEFEMKHWLQSRSYCHVTVKHFPQEAAQNPALLDCTRRMAQQGNVRWLASMDVDEYLVLYQHGHLKPFLWEHVPSGALAVFWKMMGTGGAQRFEPLPAPYRSFLGEAQVMELFKSIGHLPDISLNRQSNAHRFFLKSYDRLGRLRAWLFPSTNKTLHNTAGTYIPVELIDTWSSGAGTLLPYREEDVAVVYHYGFRSLEEYIEKRKKGRATVRWTDMDDSLVEQAIKGQLLEGSHYDDRAWKAFVRLVPEYSYLEGNGTRVGAT